MLRTSLPKEIVESFPTSTVDLTSLSIEGETGQSRTRESGDQRQFPRFEHDAPLTVIALESEDSFVSPQQILARIENLSQSGIALMTECKLPGKKVWLRFSNPEVGQAFFIEADIVSVQQESGSSVHVGEQYRYRMHFRDTLSDEDLNHILSHHLTDSGILALQANLSTVND